MLSPWSVTSESRKRPSPLSCKRNFLFTKTTTQEPQVGLFPDGPSDRGVCANKPFAKGHGCWAQWGGGRLFLQTFEGLLQRDRPLRRPCPPESEFSPTWCHHNPPKRGGMGGHMWLAGATPSSPGMRHLRAPSSLCLPWRKSPWDVQGKGTSPRMPFPADGLPLWPRDSPFPTAPSGFCFCNGTLETSRKPSLRLRPSPASPLPPKAKIRGRGRGCPIYTCLGSVSDGK